MEIGIDRAVNEKSVRKAWQVLVDNGIEPDEAGEVLQAVGYALLDVELGDVIQEALK